MLKRTQFFLSALFIFCMAVNISIAYAQDEKYYNDATAFDPTTISLTAASSDIAYGAGVPVGTVVAWPHADLPNGATQSACTASVSSSDVLAHGCEWLICDGSTINSTAYPALVGIIGTTLPDLKGRFLEGSNGTVGETKKAGLPNIEGAFTATHMRNSYLTSTAGQNGAFKWTISTHMNLAGSNYLNPSLDVLSFDASLSNPIYGSSETVQPASYTVNYLIKAY